METPKRETRSPPQQDEPELKKTKISSTTTSDNEETTAAHNNNTTPKTKNETEHTNKKRYKRRKIAIFFAYCGVGYQGMQKNPGAKTIEGELEQALYHSGAVPDEDRGAPRRYDWSRSARTDKGVSAVGQVVSGSFYVDPPGFVDRLNAFLPDQIRIFGFKRTTPSFSAKTFCYRRRYVYLIPVFALDPSRHCGRETVVSSSGSGVELAKCPECFESGMEVEGVSGNNGGIAKGDIGMDNAGERTLSNSEMEPVVSLLGNGTAMSEELDSKVEEGVKGDLMEDEMAKIAYTREVVEKEENNANREEMPVDKENNANREEMPVDKENFTYGVQERERFNRILNYYVGTHNFHNFTSRTKAEDPSAKRYIVSFNANTTVTVEGIEFVKCEVVGQSFMLHQIRNMIGLAVAIMRNCAPESLIETAFRKDVNINVPMAPEVGLYLDECFFTSYNQKWKKTHEELSMKSYEKEAEDFKMKYIYSHIASTEHKEGVVALWLHYLNHRDYPDLRFADPRETVEVEDNTCKATAEEIPEENSAREKKIAGEILEEKCAAEEKKAGEIPEDVTGQ